MPQKKMMTNSPRINLLSHCELESGLALYFSSTDCRICVITNRSRFNTVKQSSLPFLNMSVCMSLYRKFAQSFISFRWAAVLLYISMKSLVLRQFCLRLLSMAFDNRRHSFRSARAFLPSMASGISERLFERLSYRAMSSLVRLRKLTNGILTLVKS